MSEENYNRILNKVSEVSGISKDDLGIKVEAKRSKLAGLISKDGALQVIAAELGVSFENEKLKINELSSGMKKVNTVGKIINVSPVRTFTTKAGDVGKVVNLVVADDTSNIKVVLWDMNHIMLIENETIGEGKVVEIFNGNMRDNEIHLGSFSELKESAEVFDSIITGKVVKEKDIIDFRVGEDLKVRAFIVQAFDPKFFNVCSECKKKVVLDGENFVCVTHGNIAPERRALINLVIDDGTESINAVLFHEQLALLGLTAYDDNDMLLKQKNDLLGKEMFFVGQVRMNKFFNRPEFSVDSVEEVNIDELVSSLQ